MNFMRQNQFRELQIATWMASLSNLFIYFEEYAQNDTVCRRNWNKNGEITRKHCAQNAIEKSNLTIEQNNKTHSHIYKLTTRPFPQ